MSVTIKPGTRLYSAVCATELIAIKAPSTAIELTIGGVEALTEPGDQPKATIVDGHDAGTLLGKRYVDEGNTVELLCTKPGAGSPAVGGAPLTVKDAKQLPASD